MTDLTGKTVAVLATHGFEQSELTEPIEALMAAKATVHVVSPQAGRIRGWQKTDWGTDVDVDRTLDEARAEDYDMLVLPGGQINPDLLRVDERALSFVRSFHENGRPIAAICHAPWLLIEAGLAKGRRMTSYNSMKTDVANAGAHWVDEACVVDDGIITSRDPGDLPAFCAKIVETAATGRTAA